MVKIKILQFLLIKCFVVSTDESFSQLHLVQGKIYVMKLFILQLNKHLNFHIIC
jgi:hypothetical protein